MSEGDSEGAEEKETRNPRHSPNKMDELFALVSGQREYQESIV